MDGIKILSKLIGYKTDASIKSHKDCNLYITSILKEKGWKVGFVDNEQGNKKNIVAVLNGNLKDINNGLLLSGHIDTVTTNREAWATDPFTLTIKDDVMYGLGVADMKYFTATVLSLTDEIKELKLKKPIILALTCDEETIMQGINSVVKYFKQNKIKPEFGIIGEPNSKEFSNSNKGFYEFETVINGKACHSSNPKLGTNAIYIMSKVITFIENLCEKYIEKGTTINLGVINGGKLCNIVPDKCTIRWDVRTFYKPHLTKIQNEVTKFLNNLIKQYKNASFSNDIVFKIPVFEKKENCIVNKLIKKYGFKEKPYDAATEAGFYQEIGIDCTIFGVGDIKDAHAINEKLNKKDFIDYKEILLSMIKDICC